MKMSKELKQFYRDLQAWIDAGMPESRVFSPRRAICYALLNWAVSKKVGDADLPFQVAGLVGEGLELFALNGLDEHFPFNQGLADWELEWQSKSFYENPERLDFIKEAAR